MQVNIHALLPNSLANGPGNRMVIWFQGCPLDCPNCFNPETHSFDEGEILSIDEICNQIREQLNHIEGITISGGEPFSQPDALYQLVYWIRGNTNLSILVFSGYTCNEIARQNKGASILEYIDVLVEGRYVDSKHKGYGLLGSSNQKIRFLSQRYTMDQISGTPECEIIIDEKGSLIVSGVEPIDIKTSPGINY